MPMSMIAGAVLFLAGVLTFLVLLVASGGALRSRQFAVLGQIRSGAMGAGRRRLLLLSFALIGAGAIGCFAGVGAMDRERAARCEAYCTAQGYSQGAIGPSIDRSKAGRFIACTCSGTGRDALELRADAIPRVRM